MGKKLYVEDMGTPLTYKEAPKGSNALGRLEGVGGSWKDPTRNERLYDKRLWQNVMNSENFKEGMETKTIFAEANHPEERIDIDLKEVAGVLTDMQILDNGDLFTAFDILPTPNGKIIKILIDYGCKIGVSSRGLGDEIIENGVTKIDPDTYEYYCHDFVVTPAVKKARPEVVENKHSATFVSNLTDIVNEAKTREELQSIKRLIESTNVSEKTTIVESIENKISSLSESADDQSKANIKISQTADTEVEQVSLEKSKNKIKDLENQLASKDAKIEKLTAQLKRRGKNAAYFRKALQEQDADRKDLEVALTDGLDSISSLSKELTESQIKYSRQTKSQATTIQGLRKQLTEAQNRVRTLSRRNMKLSNSLTQVEKELDTQSGQIQKLNELLAETEENNRVQKTKVKQLEKQLERADIEKATAEVATERLTESNSAKIQHLSKQLHGSKQLEEDLKKRNTALNAKLKTSKSHEKQLEATNAKLLDSYIQKSCQAANLSYEAVISRLVRPYTTEAVNKVIEELSDRQRRFDMLPISMPAISGRVVEHNSHASSKDEEIPAFVVESLKRGGR